MKILMIDNYDSFTYNLVYIVKKMGVNISVIRNDKLNLNEVAQYDKIIFSPGPGLPKDAGLMMEIIDQYHQEKPMLGICLGHQAIGSYFGGELFNLPQVYHGIQDNIEISTESELFKDLPSTIEVGRYHSWAVRCNSEMPIQTIASDKNEQCMAIQHQTLPIYGVQFHPESILTPQGATIIKNFIQ